MTIKTFIFQNEIGRDKEIGQTDFCPPKVSFARKRSASQGFQRPKKVVDFSNLVVLLVEFEEKFIAKWLVCTISGTAIPGSNTTSFMLCYDVKIIGISHNDPGMLQGHCVIL